MGNVGLTRDELLIVLRNWGGPNAVTEFLVKEAVENNAARNAPTIIQPAVQFVRSAPPRPLPDVVAPYKGGNNCMYLESPPKEILEAIARATRTAVSNPIVQRTAVVGTGAGTGATATAATTGFMGAVRCRFRIRRVAERKVGDSWRIRSEDLWQETRRHYVG